MPHPDNPQPADYIEENFRQEFWGGLRANVGKWVQVPIGAPRLETAQTEHLTTVDCKYQQKDESYCLVYALASALHYVGLTDAGSKLAAIAERTTDLNPKDQLKVIKAHMMEYAPSIALFEAFGKIKKKKKNEEIKIKDITDNKTKFPTIVIPIGKDYSTNHAVCVVDDLIFDSTQQFALKLKVGAFNWIVGCEEGIESIYGAVRFCRPKEKRYNKLYIHEMRSNW